MGTSSWRSRELRPVWAGAFAGGLVGPSFQDDIGYWWSCVVVFLIMIMVLSL